MPPDPATLRLLIAAPFKRGLDHGGSQRATSMAERLEERGVRIEWRFVEARSASRPTKLRANLALRPTALELYAPPAAEQPGLIDVALAAHSYLAPQLASMPPDVARVIDFHNLEWRHLTDSAKLAPGLRRPYLHAQARLMRRFERRTIASSHLSLFVSNEELDWARSVAPGSRLSLVPSVLPKSAEEAALALSNRAKSDAEARLVYVGTLRFPPNLAALMKFLLDAWPAIRGAVRGARLTIAGDCSEEERRQLDSFPGVEALGFVEDVGPLLAQSAAVVMPIEGRAGTSLRALYYALAGVWVIGTSAAFRGLSWKMGAVVESPEQWARCVSEAIHDPGAQEPVIEEARAAALELQRDPKPWDDLFDRVTALREGV